MYNVKKIKRLLKTQKAKDAEIAELRRFQDLAAQQAKHMAGKAAEKGNCGGGAAFAGRSRAPSAGSVWSGLAPHSAGMYRLLARGGGCR